MSSVAVQVMPSVTNFSKDSLIANKLASDLDAKLVSSSKKVLLQRIEFKPASKPDQQYEDLKKKYVPLNSQCTNGNQRREPLRSPDKDPNDELPPPKVVLFPKENVELNWKQIRRVGPGLNNMGNTCFLNSVLQVLTYTPPLVNYLASKEHTGKCAQTNVIKTVNCSCLGCPTVTPTQNQRKLYLALDIGRSVGFCMLCELQKHIVRSFGHHQGEAIKPMAIIQKLKFIAKHLRFGHQEDAHEFLRYVIDGMQRSCLAADGYTEKLDRMSKHTTMVHQVFGGYYRSQVRCLKCKNNSNTFDPLMDIMLDIKHAPTVERALQRSVKLELLDGENLYMCPRCKRKVPAHKQFLIHHAPNILTLQLKRFDYNQSFGGKITKQIEYTEHLNLRPYMTSQGAPIKYRLYAVLVHSGYSSNSGHYYCYIRASNGIWYLMNDSIVRQVTLKAVLSQQAYLLFYTKLTPTQDLKSPSTNSPKTTPLVRTPGTPKEHPPKLIQPNDLGTPVKSGIQFHRNPPSTSTVTKPLTTPTTNPAASVPLTSFQKPKFSFTISAANKGNKADLSKAKQGGNKHGERSEDIGVRPKLSSSTDENAASEIKSPIASSDKRRETVAQSESSQYPAKIDGSSVNEKSHVNVSQKEKTKTSSGESTPSKKDEKGKIISPSKKPRPPPLFIPRAVVQGKGTPQSAPRATTPWKVTPKTTTEPLFGPMSPPPPGTAPPQPSPSSAMSDTSSTSSVVGKTGEWMVTDKTVLTPGPKLPERQHAGWQVSRKPESNTAEELGTPKGGGDTEVNGKESDKKKKKKKHKKEKKKKKKKKKEKSKKKYEQLSESDEEEEEEKEKQKNKKQKNDRSEEQNRSEEKSKSKKQKRKHKGYDDDDDDDENNTNPSKKPCLVSYADSSSSSSDEHATSSREAGKSGNVDSQGSTTESRVPVIHDDEPRKKSAARRATWDGSRDSSTVAQLLSGSKGLHGYGSSVASWEGGENVVDSSGGKPERKRQRRDSWDEDYDRGKEKKVQKNKGIRERHFNGNPFQREHDKRSTNQGFKERFSRQPSKNNHSHHGHFSKSHSSRKYRRLSS